MSNETREPDTPGLEQILLALQATAAKIILAYRHNGWTAEIQDAIGVWLGTGATAKEAIEWAIEEQEQARV